VVLVLFLVLEELVSVQLSQASVFFMLVVVAGLLQQRVLVHLLVVLVVAVLVGQFYWVAFQAQQTLAVVGVVVLALVALES
jgi:hypothetical protein